MVILKSIFLKKYINLILLNQLNQLALKNSLSLTLHYDKLLISKS